MVNPAKLYYRMVKSFSVKQEKAAILNGFLAFCEREHITFSDGVVWALEDFLKRHTPPNPQPTLDRCLSLGMPVKPNTMCFVPECRAKAQYQLVLKNFKGEEQLFNVCARHKRWKHKEYRFVVRHKKLSLGGS